ncbi:hypothetical protein ACFLV4_01890 [Chloroflexota bacterium]
MSMPKLDPDYLESLIALLGTADTGPGAGAEAEPRTLHRRGQWFKSTTAHHTVQYVELLSQLR